MDKSLITKKLLIEINTLKCSNFKLLDETDRNGLSLTFLKWYIDYAITNCVGITEVEIVNLLKSNLKTVDKVRHDFDFESFKIIVSQSLLSKPISRDLKIAAKEEFKIFYPHWTEKDIDTVISKLWNRFYLLLTNDPSFILEIIHIGYYDVKINLKEEDTEIKISHWTKQNFIAQIANLYFYGYNKKEKIKMVNIDDYPNIAFDESIAEENCYDKLDNYYNWIIKDKILTGRELKLLVLIIKSIKESNEKGNFSKILKQIALEEGYTDGNFRKVLSELSKVMKKPENKKYKDLLLTYVNTEEDEIQQITELIINLIETQLIMKNHLQAYRFSEQEMNKMIELKVIFEQNDFEINRFPEVYYDDYDNYEEIYGKIKDPDENIDYLGVYTDFWIPSDEINSKEGIIVLFKDRIENYCYEKQMEVNSVRFIVLMHELGHWLTHWATYNNENWSKGYKAGTDKKTHESLAQLIAFWAVEDNSNLKNLLETRLTPANNPNNPYALYKNLIKFSKSIILNKLIEIRKHAFLTDDLMYAFLSSDAKFMYEIFTKNIEIGGHNSISLLNEIDKPNESFDDTIFDLLVNINKERKTTSCGDFPICLLGEYKFKEKFKNEFSQIFIDCRGAILACKFGL